MNRPHIVAKVLEIINENIPEVCSELRMFIEHSAKSLCFSKIIKIEYSVRNDITLGGQKYTDGKPTGNYLVLLPK